VHPTVVYVHGNGNKVRKELLKAEWDKALFGNHVGATSRMAYWASLRYAAPLPDPEFDEAELVRVSPFSAICRLVAERSLASSVFLAGS
jgi:hypothetical protein